MPFLMRLACGVGSGAFVSGLLAAGEFVPIDPLSGGGGTALGVFATLVVQYFLRLRKINSDHEQKEHQLIFREGQDLRNDLRREVLDLRERVTKLQQDKLDCREENIELKATLKLLSEELAELKSEIHKLKAVPPASPGTAPVTPPALTTTTP